MGCGAKGGDAILTAVLELLQGAAGMLGAGVRVIKRGNISLIGKITSCGDDVQSSSL